MYQEALRLHQKERYSEAKSIYEEILADDLIQDGSVTMVTFERRGEVVHARSYRDDDDDDDLTTRSII